MLLFRSAAGRSSACVPRAQRAFSCCHWFAPQEGGDDIWQVDVTRLKYGPGAILEVGEDARDMGLRRVAVFTDKGLIGKGHVERALESLKKQGVEPVLYDEVTCEPTDVSFKAAIEFAKQANVDGFVSVGGGSVMDTCKAAQLYSTHADRDFLAFVNAPIGRGEDIPAASKPHIAIPTTSGTGSESTGLAIFDLLEMHAKTGVVSRSIRPTLAIVDPTTTFTMPGLVVACSGFDVLSHALESYTARPFTRRPAPATPAARPMSQGANPYSDIGCIEALKLCGRYLTRAVNDPDDHEARDKMMFASTLAGIAFGNCGCHLPHGLSYQVSGMVREYEPPEGYPRGKPIVPHGMSVILNAPSVFRFTADACPERHIEAAAALGADMPASGVAPEEAGDVLSERIIELMKSVKFPSGLNDVGFTDADVDALAAGAEQQRRLIDNASKQTSKEDIKGIYRGAMSYWQ